MTNTIFIDRTPPRVQIFLHLQSLRQPPSTLRDDGTIESEGKVGQRTTYLYFCTFITRCPSRSIGDELHNPIDIRIPVCPNLWQDIGRGPAWSGAPGVPRVPGRSESKSVSFGTISGVKSQVETCQRITTVYYSTLTTVHTAIVLCGIQRPIPIDASVCLTFCYTLYVITPSKYFCPELCTTCTANDNSLYEFINLKVGMHHVYF